MEKTVYILFENYGVYDYAWMVEGYTTNESLAINWVMEDRSNRKYESCHNCDTQLYKKHGIDSQ